MDVFIAGEPVLFMTSKAREIAWTTLVQDAVQPPIGNPHLAFVVGSLTRSHQPFDIDNLAKPVLEVVAPAPESVWITVEAGVAPGVRIRDEVPLDLAEPFIEVRIAAPPERSVRFAALPELVGAIPIEPVSAALALELTFDSATTRIGDFGFDGPIKPLIDALAPFFGRYANGPADHRVRDLRIRKGAQPTRRDVRVRVCIR